MTGTDDMEGQDDSEDGDETRIIVTITCCSHMLDIDSVLLCDC